MSAALRVLKPGLLTTVQDLGRRGYQGLGVSVAGPMDWYSHRLANRIVGNEASAAALEVTIIGPELACEGNVVCAVAGARFDLTVDGRHVPPMRPFPVHDGQVLRFGARAAGARATLAVRGGFDVPDTFGSRATHLVSSTGPFGGRSLQAGDLVPVGSASTRLRFLEARPLPLGRGRVTLRAMPGPHLDRFGSAAIDTLCGGTYLVTPDSNRMAYRLAGPVLEQTRGADILSEGTPVGALQVPSSGQPMLLMADAQTTGGYTIAAVVVRADLPLAGQLAPGDRVAFTMCSREAAIAALREREAALA